MSDDVFTDDDTANAEDRMRQAADYGTVRDWNGRPSKPSPLPAKTPFSVGPSAPSEDPLRSALAKLATEALAMLDVPFTLTADSAETDAGPLAISRERVRFLARAALAHSPVKVSESEPLTEKALTKAIGAVARVVGGELFEGGIRHWVGLSSAILDELGPSTLRPEDGRESAGGDWWTDGAMVNEGQPGDEGFVGDAATAADAERIVERHNATVRAALTEPDAEETR